LSSLYLVDTNVPSELAREMPDRNVVAWNLAQPDSSLYISVISLGEVRKGINSLPIGKKRREVELWLELRLLPLFQGRILPVSQPIADRWGRIAAERQSLGQPLATADGLIAATALEHNLTLVTRNTRDFTGLAVTILNPWDA